MLKDYSAESFRSQEGTSLQVGPPPVGLPAGEPVGEAGLSYSSYLTERDKRPSFVLTAYSGAYLVDCKPLQPGGALLKSKRVGGGVRNKITDMSASSHRGLVRQVNKLDHSQVEGGLFITLTYPRELPPDVAVSKTHLARFRKSLLRLYPTVAAVWKLEPHRDGWPHYHLLMLGAPSDLNLQEFRLWVSKTWWRVVGSGLSKALLAGTGVDRVRNSKGASGYMAKYMTKDKGKLLDSSPGRFWGVFGDIGKYEGVPVVVDLPPDEVSDLFRLLDKSFLARARGRKDEQARARAIRRARRRRADNRSRWYLIGVDGVLHYLDYIGRKPAK